MGTNIRERGQGEGDRRKDIGRKDQGKPQGSEEDEEEKEQEEEEEEEEQQRSQLASLGRKPRLRTTTAAGTHLRHRSRRVYTSYQSK